MTRLARGAACLTASGLLLLCCAPAALASSSADASPSPSDSAAPVVSADAVVLDGKGFGHGVGLQQDGALTMGRQGLTVDAILGAFYPGTTYAKGSGPVRVAVDTQPSAGAEILTATTAATLHGDADTAVPPGTVVTVRHTATGWSALLHDPSGDPKPSSSAKVRGEVLQGGLLDPSGSVAPSSSDPAAAPSSSSASPSDSLGGLIPPSTASASDSAAPSGSAAAPAATTAPAAPPASVQQTPSVSTSPSPGGLPDRTVTSTAGFVLDPGGSTDGVRGRLYQGTLAVILDADSLRAVNTVDVETYVRGLGEVLDPSWPQASLRAQVIAARTYALHARNGGPFDLWDDDRSQVYLGTQSRYAALDQAVAGTTGVVLTSGGALADTVFSASAGGVTATPEEGFGSIGGPSYLRAATYPTDDPHAWNVTTTLSQVAAQLSYPGTLTGVTVPTRGPSGRAEVVHLDGSAGGVDMTGIAVEQAMNLHSTLFTVQVGPAAIASPDPVPSPTDSLPSVLDSSGLVGPSLADVVVAGPVAAAARHHSSELSRPLVALAVVLFLGTASGIVLRQTVVPRGKHRKLPTTPAVDPNWTAPTLDAV